MTIRIVTPVDFGGPDQLRVCEVEPPRPAPGEVRVAVRAIGVNPVDWKLYSGDMGRDPHLLESFGADLSGVVDVVGDDVDGWAPGDAVIVGSLPTSAYAEQVVVPADLLVEKPSRLSFESAAAIPVVAGTAAQALEVARVGEGDTVLVHGGAGGVGTLVVQLAVRRGATVIATASEGNHDYLRGLGADPVVYGEGLEAAVREHAPEGVDAAVDTVGSDEALDVSVALVADRTRIVTIAGFARAEELGIVAINGGEDGAQVIRAAAIPYVAALVASGEVQLPVARTYPLEETAQAHRDSIAGHTRGKLVVVP